MDSSENQIAKDVSTIDHLALSQRWSALADLSDAAFQEWEFYGVPATPEALSEGSLGHPQSLQTQWLPVARILETQGGIEIFLYPSLERF